MVLERRDGSHDPAEGREVTVLCQLFFLAAWAALLREIRRRSSP